MAVAFARDRACHLCPLHESAQSVCIPARPLISVPGPPGKERALLIVGEAPGFQEDKQDSCFVGYTGRILRDVYVAGMKLDQLADIYLTNAVRCYPPQDTKPGTRDVRACFPFLVRDVQALCDTYPHVTVLTVGAISARALLSCSLKDAMRRQGSFPQSSRLEGRAVPVFSTYHPAYLSPGRSPSSIVSVEDHLTLLSDHLSASSSHPVHDGGRPDLPVRDTILRAPRPPAHVPSLLCLDIETYGIRSNMQEQRYFHPQKSIVFDGVPASQLIRTVSLAWYAGPAIKTALFLWQSPRERSRLREWLHRLASISGTLLGMNVVFDLSYIRTADALFRPSLPPPSSMGGEVRPTPRRRSTPHIRTASSTPYLHLVDLAVFSYLHAELRPERSLKDLAALFLGLDTYGPRSDRNLALRRYPSDTDPDLWVYNCRDTYATLWLYGYFRDRIAADYGSSSRKLSAYTLRWYSDLLWLILHMTETGVRFDRSRLEDLRCQAASSIQRLSRDVSRHGGGPFQGKGSAAWSTRLFRGASRHVPSDVQLELKTTKATKRISTVQFNAQLLLHHLPSESPYRVPLTLLEEFRSAQKLLTSYLAPMLDSTLLPDGAAYPSWYVVPMTRKDTSEEGGTNQGRITCKDPALQTSPSPVKDAVTCRFHPGWLLKADYSQLELRVAALLSGDPTMLQQFADDEDLHAATTIAIFGPDIIHRSDFSTYREVGKRQNFRALYRGGPRVFHETVFQAVGVDIPISECIAVDTRFWKRYPVLRRWQDTLLADAKRFHYLELPLTGQSRSFHGSARAVEESYLNVIVNFPIQATAANIMLSAQSALLHMFRARRLSACMGLQTYDSVIIECPWLERDTVRSLLTRVLPVPPYFCDLCSHLYRTVPLTYDLKETYIP